MPEQKVGENKIIDVALVARDINERCFLRGLFDHVQRIHVQVDAVINGVPDPSEQSLPKPHIVQVEVSGDFVEIAISLLTHRFNGSIVGTGSALHSFLQVLIMEDDLFHFPSALQNWTRHHPAVPVNAVDEFPTKLESETGS